ncbi:MAG: hypothetical protein D6767_00645 [Candidatus Hydrogenedentota bacterium]|nr:MAG: hypothetical protein D6767_00645 [Candidatus Hydrogenedentota bacterium]
MQVKMNPIIKLGKIISLIFLSFALVSLPVFAQEAAEDTQKESIIPGTSDADKAAAEAEKKASEAENAEPPQENNNQDEEQLNKEARGTGNTQGDNGNTQTTETKEDSKSSGIYDDGKNIYATSKTKFALESADNLSQTKYIEYKIDDSPYQKYQNPIKIEAEGQHRIVYRSVDQAGNVEPEKVYLVIIDNSAPDVNLSTKEELVESNGFIYGPAKVTVQITATDAYSGVKSILYATGEGDFQEYKDAIILDKSGEHIIRYKAVDNLGNETEVKVFRVIVDAEAPSVTIQPKDKLVKVGDKLYAKRDNVFTISAKDNSSGIERIEVKIDGEAEFKPYTNPLVFNVEGNHTIEARAIDKVGNVSEVVKLEFITDDNPPATTLKPVK